MEDALNSRSDLEALKRSGRGKVVVLGLLAAGAVGGAAWSFMSPQGTGNPEELHKVIVVSSTSGRSISLSNLGFDAAEGSLAAWVRKANNDVPDLEVEGVEAVMQLADRFGYAWVVFENPQDVDFSALDIEGGVPSFPESAKFVALSSGDLAFPHNLTVNPEPSDVVRGASTIVLQTLFAQPALAETLGDNESPSIAVIQLRDRLSDAIERVERVGPAELMVKTIVADVQQLVAESDRAQPRANLVGETLEVTTPVPLPNGQVLSIARGYSLVAHDAVRVDVDLDPAEQFLVGPPGAAPRERHRCDALAGGALGEHEAGKYWFADDGSAILIKRLSDGMTLWTIAASAEPCGFVSAGKVAAAEPGFGSGAPALAPGSSGRIARTGYVAGQGAVSVASAGSHERTVLGMVDGVELSGPRWVGDRFIVVRASPVGSASGGLLLLDIERPMLALALPAALFGGALEIDEVAVGGTPQAPVVAVTAGADLRRLYAWSPGPLAALFNAPPVDTELAEASPEAVFNEREGLPTVVLLDTNRLTATVVTGQGNPRNLSVSPDGQRVAFRVVGDGTDATEPGDDELAVASLLAGDGGVGLKVLTLNGLRDYSPRFTADGAHLAFRTRFDVPRTKWVLTAGRIVELTPR